MRAVGPACSRDGCDFVAKVNGMCPACNTRAWRLARYGPGKPRPPYASTRGLVKKRSAG